MGQSKQVKTVGGYVIPAGILMEEKAGSWAA
jgi:hypothetical protein